MNADNIVLALNYKEGESLFAEPLRRTPFLIPGLLPCGTHLLCGAPKAGKSWLALWLAIQLTNGAPVWDTPTEPCGVLYLCLEDTENRVKERLHKIADSVSRNLHVAVQCHTMAEGLVEQLENYLRMTPDTKLVIIDTLQKIRGENTDSSMYRADYTDISAIKALGDRLGVTFLLVHHLRKMPDTDDPFNMISGSNGLSGAVDGMYLLYKDKRTENIARFLMTGRDIESQEYKLRFKSCKWELVEKNGEKEDAEEPVPPVLESVERFMQGKEIWVGTATELCALLDVSVSPTVITRHLSRYAETWLHDHRLGYETARDSKRRYLGLYTYSDPDENGEQHPKVETPLFTANAVFKEDLPFT